MGEDLVHCSNEIESSDPSQCPCDHQLADKAYLSGMTVRNIHESFTHKIAAELRQCHLMYRVLASGT